jgi:hypothetical protein
MPKKSKTTAATAAEAVATAASAAVAVAVAAPAAAAAGSGGSGSSSGHNKGRSAAPAPTEVTMAVRARVCHVIFPRLMAAGGGALPSHLPQIDYAHPLARELNWGCAQYEERPEGGRERPYTGFNFPATLLTSQRTPLLAAHRQLEPFDYIIGYICDDADTLEHELRHAQFCMDAVYRKRVTKAWDAMAKKDPGRAKAVVQHLKRSEYPECVWVDEFGAYFPALVEQFK